MPVVRYYFFNSLAHIRCTMTDTSNLRKETEKMTRSILQSTPSGLLLGEFEKEYRGMIGSHFPYRRLGFVTGLDLLNSMPEVVETETLPTGHLLLRAIPDSSTEHISRMGAAQRPNEVGYNRKTSQIVREQEDFPGMGAISEPAPDRVSKKMKEDLRAILDNHPEGLPASQLSREYSKEHGLSLDYKYFGCVSVVEFCRCFPDVFAVVRGRLASSIDYWVLHNAEKVKSETCEDIQLQEVKDDIASKTADFPPAGQNNPLCKQSVDPKHDIYEAPHISTKRRDNEKIRAGLWKNLLKEGNVVGPHDTIPQQELPTDLRVGDLLEVIVTQVFSPNKFCVQLKDKGRELESLMKEMEDFYFGDSANEYKVPDSYVVVGSFCAHLSADGSWYRSLVTSMKDLSTVEVLYIDYGDMVRVKKDSLLYIHKKFASLPSQTFQAWLAEIKPPEGLRRYPWESSERFRHLTKASPVGYCAIYHGGSRDKLCLSLIDTYTNDLPEGKAINLVLVNEGLAELDTPPASQVSTVASTDENHNLIPSQGSSQLLEDIQRELDSVDRLDGACRMTPGGMKIVEAGLQRQSLKEDFRCVLLGGQPCFIVNKQGKAWLAGQQISRFVPSWRHNDILQKMLNLNNMSVESLVVTEASDPTLYEKIKAALGDTAGDEIILYPLKSVTLILKFFLKLI